MKSVHNQTLQTVLDMHWKGAQWWTSTSVGILRKKRYTATEIHKCKRNDNMRHMLELWSSKSCLIWDSYELYRIHPSLSRSFSIDISFNCASIWSMMLILWWLGAMRLEHIQSIIQSHWSWEAWDGFYCLWVPQGNLSQFSIVWCPLKEARQNDILNEDDCVQNHIKLVRNKPQKLLFCGAFLNYLGRISPSAPPSHLPHPWQCRTRWTLCPRAVALWI